MVQYESQDDPYEELACDRYECEHGGLPKRRPKFAVFQNLNVIAQADEMLVHNEEIALIEAEINGIKRRIKREYANKQEDRQQQNYREREVCASKAAQSHGRLLSERRAALDSSAALHFPFI
jgi:hypothetical protein